MEQGKTHKAELVINSFIYSSSGIFLILSIILILLSMIGNPIAGEAPIGSFAVESLNNDWSIETANGTYVDTLPCEALAVNGETVIIRNTLPGTIRNGMNLMFHAAMQDVEIYIGGEKRSSYTSDGFLDMGYYLNSGYMVVPLSDEDANREIEISVLVKNKPEISEVTFAYGNNVWFPLIKNNMVLLFSAVFLVILGVSAILGRFMMRRHMIGGKTLNYIGFLMIDIGLWLISESKMRQVFMPSPSFTLCASIWTVDLISVMAALYFDEVQKKRYHKLYFTIEVLMMLNLLVCTVLHFSGIYEYHETIRISHVQMILSLVLVGATVIKDIFQKQIVAYKVTAIGIFAFVLTGGAEFWCYYFLPGYVFGVFIFLGLVAVLLTTVIQTVQDEIDRIHKRERDREETNLKTMETIASSVYAKDEYTGGHSARVANYLTLLAREMQEEYSFSEKDIQRFRYIGLMHDIGKIAVPDVILNKNDKLNDDEFTLMRRHTIVGDQMIGSFKAIGDSRNNFGSLKDGIRHHHERYDGKGYPDGLKGSEISVVSRMLSLADAYDAMTSNRVYRPRISEEEVIADIRKCAGSQFDPDMAEIFATMIEQKKIQPVTKDGLDTNEKGEVRYSSLLEARLRSDSESVLNPSFIRMVCYLIKISEESGGKVEVFFLSTPGMNVTVKDIDDKKDAVCGTARSKLDGLDICVRYTQESVLLVLFGKDDSEEKELVSEITRDVEKITHETVVSKLARKP